MYDTLGQSMRSYYVFSFLDSCTVPGKRAASPTYKQSSQAISSNYVAGSAEKKAFEYTKSDHCC